MELRHDGDQLRSADLQSIERRLVEVEAALERLEEGSYGRCASCGVEIDDAALEADPVRATCEGCSRSASPGGNG